MVSFALSTMSTCSTLPASNAAALTAFCQGPLRPFDRAAGVGGQRVRLEKGLCVSPCVRPRIDPLTHPFRLRCTRTATGLHYARSDEALRDFVVVKDMSDPLKGRSVGSMIGTFVAQVKDCFGIGKKRSASRSVREAEDEERRRKRKDLWRRIGQVVKPEWPLLAVSTFFLVMAALIEVAVPHFSSSALNAILLQRGRLEFLHNVRSTVVLGILAAATTGMRGMCFGLAGTRIVCNLRHQLFKALLRQDIAFFDLNMTGELTNRLTSDCTKISNVVSLNVNIMGRQTIQLIGGLAYLYRLHPAMAGVSAMGLASIFLLTGIHGQYNRSMGKKIQDALATSNSAAGTSLSLIRLVRSHASESEELSRYDNKLRSLVDLMMSHDLGYGIYRLVIRISQTALLAAALMLGYRLSAAGVLSADQLTSCLFYVGFVSGASWDVGDQYVKIQDALGSATEVFKLLDQRPAMQLKTADNASLTDFSGPSATHTYFDAHASDGGSATRAREAEVMELVEDPVSHQLVDKRALQQQQQQQQQQEDQHKGEEHGERQHQEDLHLGEEGSTHAVHTHHTSPAIDSHTPLSRELQRSPLPKDLIPPPRPSISDRQQLLEKDAAGDAMVAPTDANNRDQQQRVESPVASSAKGDIVFRNVSFAYPLRGNTPVLKGINLHIPPGRRVAIVGSSGGGKSTLLRLLCRHYDADSGSIMLDGKDVTSIPQSELASSVAMLSQEPPLLPIPIGANIAYGLPPGSYSQKDIEEAARAANVHDFISSLPEGYNTQVGEGSVALSGGQKQRVAIARALIRKPRVLLLDEPTSALDAESEKAVQDALETASAGRTVLIVAHRLSTIKSAETIIVLKDGRIAEMGSHDELVRQRSLYSSLWARQGSIATSAYA